MIGKCDECYLCHRQGALDTHHCFGGNADRKKSDKYGLTIKLCRHCHNELHFSPIHSKGMQEKVRKDAEQYALDTFGWTIEDFIKVFGRNYL